MMGQLATFLYSRLAHKEATGNSAYFFEYKPHLTNSFKVACPSKEQVHEERVKSRYLSTKHSDQTSSKHFRQFFPQLSYKTNTNLVPRMYSRGMVLNLGVGAQYP
jgi:hypothetical protein